MRVALALLLVFALGPSMACDGPSCGDGRVTAIAVESIAVTAYEDSPLDVPLPTGGAGAAVPRDIALTAPPHSGRVTFPSGNGHLTYHPDAGFTGTDVFAVTLTDADRTTRTVAVAVTVQSSYAVRPILFAGLRQGSPPVGEVDRPELRDGGEYALVRLSALCSALGCEHIRTGEAHVVRLGARGVRWVEGNPFVNNLAGDYQQFPLAAMPEPDGNDWWFPLRSLAEELGLSTTFDAASGQVKVFELLPALREIPVTLADRVVGADFGTTRLFAAYEDADSYWLLYDASADIIRVRKNDFSYSRLSADPRYGVIHSFAVTPQGEIYAGTSLGYLLQWRNGRFEKVAGDGARTLESPGDAMPLADLKFEFVSDMVFRPDGRVLYIHDWVIDALFAVDLDARTVRLLADEKMIGGLTNLSLLDGRPEWVGHDGIHVIDPDTLRVTDGHCFPEMFASDDIPAVRYVPLSDLWLYLNARTREIIEARDPLGSRSSGCAIVRRTFAGDGSSYLFTFAASNVEQGDSALVVDNSSKMLIRYTVGGALSILSAKQLGVNAHLSWLGPAMAIEHDNALYLVANRSHQVLRYSLADRTTVPYLGTGVASRGGPAQGGSLSLDVGYPSAERFVDGELWLGDNYGRRIVVTDGVSAHELFAPTDPKVMSAVTGFDRVGDVTYIVDHALGRILAYRQGSASPVQIAGEGDPDITPQAPSIASMTNFASVRFGLPVSLTAFTNGMFLVADDGRKGIWLLDPADRSVRPLAGFRTPAAGSTWGSVGNVGLSAKDVRLAGLSVVTYDAARQLLLVPSRISRKIVFMRADLGKTCEADLRGMTISPQQAFFLEDGRLVVVDYDASAVLLFAAPDLSCLATAHPD